MANVQRSHKMNTEASPLDLVMSEISVKPSLEM